MKVLIGISSASWGGAQKYVYELTKYLTKKGNKITVVIGESGLLESKLNFIANVKVIRLNHFVNNFDHLLDLEAIEVLKRIYDDINPDIIMLNSTKMGMLGRLANKRKIPLIFVAHGWSFSNTLLDECTRERYINIERKLQEMTDLTITVSKEDFNTAKALGFNINKFTTIYNWLDDLGIKEHKKLYNEITMVARFAKQKDQLSLIKAMAYLPKIKLNLAGSGETLAECKNYVIEHNLKNVKFYNNLNKNEIDDLLKHTDIAMMISNFEGFSFSGLEAVSHKLPLIISTVSGCNDLANKNYIIPKGNDPKIIAQKVKLLYKNDPIAIGLGHYNKVKGKLNKEGSLKQTLSEIEGLVGSKQFEDSVASAIKRA